MTKNSGKQQPQAQKAKTRDTAKTTDDRITAAGDNRRAGDQDGNQAGGDSKSPGATEAGDESDPATGKRA